MVVFILAMSFVFAASINSDDNQSGNETNKTSHAGGVANMTYGHCVSEAAKLRSDCYKTSATQSKTCVTGAAKDRNASSQCKQTAKDGKGLCQSAFKETKKSTCGQIKAMFLEKLIYGGM